MLVIGVSRARSTLRVGDGGGMVVGAVSRIPRGPARGPPGVRAVARKKSVCALGRALRRGGGAVVVVATVLAVAWSVLWVAPMVTVGAAEAAGGGLGEERWSVMVWSRSLM